MTRDEFIKRFESPMNVEERIQLYVDSGMLKLDEPKSEQDRVFDALVAPNEFSHDVAEHILKLLHKANLKIVEK